MAKAVSDNLVNSIKYLMELDELQDFYLGGGTNLALKYGYRKSTDIDLFSDKIIGLENLKHIESILKKTPNISISIYNNSSENLSFIKADFPANGELIKVEIIQNLKLYHPIQKIDNIRLINDLDIGALKLVSFANRGTRKDLYDLYFLVNKYGLTHLHSELCKRIQIEDISKLEYQNIFNIDFERTKINLSENITPLGDMNKLKDLSKPNNRVDLLEDSLFDKLSLPVLQKKWINLLQELSQEKGLLFNETKNISTTQKRKKGFRM